MSGSDLKPESGVRVRLDLSETREQGADYAVTLFLVDGEKTGRASVPSEGAIELDEIAGAPAYALAAARAFLRQAQSSFRTVGRWPHRVLRWRAEK